MGDHSKLSASGMDRILTCPGSLELPIQDDGEGSIYAREGTAAHKMVEQIWLLGCEPEDFLGTTIDGFEVTQEMCDSVRIYMDTIDTELKKLPGHDKVVKSETRMIHPELEEFGGTVDTLLLSDTSLAVVDFKFGVAVPVEIDNNSQLKSYLLLALAEYGSALNVNEFRVTVVQPRCPHPDGPVRTAIITIDELKGFAKRVRDVAEGKRAGEFQAGTHCRWCPGKIDCPANREATLAMAKLEFAPESMTPELAAEILSKAKQVQAFIKVVEQWAHGQADKGVGIPGWKLVNTFGNRRYSVDESEVVRKCKNRKFGKKLIYETKLLSPAQLEKVVGKPLVATMTEKPHKGTTLVPEKDKREAVERQSAVEEFSDKDVQ